MISIWKFNLQTIDKQVIEMPVGAELLTVQIQNGEPCLWARVDNNEMLEQRQIAIHGTGHELPDTTRKYIGTYQMAGGGLIFHVFESLSLC